MTTGATTDATDDAVQANIVGCCAISLPTGKHSNGLPFGIQLMAPNFNDLELLAFSHQIMNK